MGLFNRVSLEVSIQNNLFYSGKVDALTIKRLGFLTVKEMWGSGGNYPFWKM